MLLILICHMICHMICHIISYVFAVSWCVEWPVTWSVVTCHMICHVICHVTCHMICHVICHVICQMICHLICYMITWSVGRSQEMCMWIICKSIQDICKLVSLCVFLAVFGQTSSSDFFYLNTLYRLFVESPISPDHKTITFQNMATVEDFWEVIRYY